MPDSFPRGSDPNRPPAAPARSTRCPFGPYLGRTPGCVAIPGLPVRGAGDAVGPAARHPRGGAGAERASPCGSRNGRGRDGGTVQALRGEHGARYGHAGRPPVVDSGSGAQRAAGGHPTILPPGIAFPHHRRSAPDNRSSLEEPEKGGGVARLTPPRRNVLPQLTTARLSSPRESLPTPRHRPPAPARIGLSRELERPADGADCRPRAHPERAPT